MIMCHLKYRNLGKSDFATWQEWVNAVNANESYCSQLPKHRVREYRFKCRAVDLPSIHPYWRMVGHSRRAVIHKKQVRALRIGVKDPKIMAIRFRPNTPLFEVHGSIKKQLEDVLNNDPGKRQAW